MRLIDADALLEAIEELKKSPWYNGENGNFERIVRSDAIGIIEDLCVKEAPTIDYAPKWISVKERLPKEGENCYLVRLEDGFIGTAVWDDGWELWNDSGEVTHWMPLPEPPKEENE